MANFWFKAATSSIVVNGSNQPIDCATCPCGDTCGCCSPMPSGSLFAAMTYTSPSFRPGILPSSVELPYLGKIGLQCTWFSTQSWLDQFPSPNYVYELNITVVCEDNGDGTWSWRYYIYLGVLDPTYTGAAGQCCWRLDHQLFSTTACSPLLLETGSINLLVPVVCSGSITPNASCPTPVTIEMDVTE